jgi:putative hydrolase of HD superfamily
MLKTLIELQRLKRLERTGWSLRGQPNGTESVAAHSFGVGVTAMMLADEVNARGGEVDCERVLRMALLHDWAETRVGDLPRTATEYFGADARKTAETRAFADIVEHVGAAAAEYKTLYQDYEQRESVEAKLVKAADVIDLLVQTLALESAGARGLDEFWEVAGGAAESERPDVQLPAIAQQLPAIAQAVVSEVLESLLAARATIKK